MVVLVSKPQKYVHNMLCIHNCVINFVHTYMWNMKVEEILAQGIQSPFLLSHKVIVYCLETPNLLLKLSG